MTSTFRTLTVPLDGTASAGGLPQFLVRDDVLCWTRREAGLVGFGEIARFTATGPERFLEADIWWRHLVLEADITDSVELPGTGPVAFGSFAFSKKSTHVSRLIVPEIVVGVRDGRYWLTQLTVDDGELTEAGALAALAGWLSGGSTAGDVPAEPAGAVVRPLPSADGATLHTGSLSEEDWMAAVAAGVAEIRTGALEKLVLARDIVATVPSGVNAAQVLRELAVRYRECWTYGVDGLVGATPEMLIQVEGRTAQARVLAGTLDRRDAHGESGIPMDYAERVLAGSEKQRHEHEIAIQSLTSQLAPFSEAMNAHDEPFILELPNVWHLASDVKAELAEVEGHVPTCLALINALHPTAAVCGTPTLVAGALIRKLEHLDRGPYAGPVGWLDAAGNGEWGIALRGAVIEDPHTVRLYAGCGIVDGSQPEAELAETWAKFRPMLESLGISN
ncbi:isochorismate synthase [Pseudarthrobacter raffinosi]|uniref:isochorismate synthase n=1 Tax=Pseudarthrobacter raffinosi TaxID=2953651 RepID=UPI00208E103A|nr:MULTISPECIES: isochorismate synthase [unclassified Pseudarthrobacter]MCO4236241.1 isochorismate synthase [Pseudarthrobacter sp. MDT3-28]MCO4250443.1 isochorismate synthase [Pseudarthrobacter sp. MDT3-9]MCO4262581.1 isochorismate synthase [Pseudarthrobacter sp. MDT3-26]